jgi:hypothetical protein
MITIGADRFRSKAAASPEFGAGSGGDMDDFSKQLDSIERVVVEIRTKLDTVLPHLATKAELAPVLTALPHLATKGQLAPVLTALPHLATKAELAPILTALPHLATKAELAPALTALPHLATKAELEEMRTDLIKWIVGAALSSVAAATAITLIASRITWH